NKVSSPAWCSTPSCRPRAPRFSSSQWCGASRCRCRSCRRSLRTRPGSSSEARSDGGFPRSALAVLRAPTAAQARLPARQGVALVVQIRAAHKLVPKRGNGKNDWRRKLEAELGRLGRRLDEIAAVDYFHASGRETAVGLLEELQAKMKAPASGAAEEAKPETF